MADREKEVLRRKTADIFNEILQKKILANYILDKTSTEH